MKRSQFMIHTQKETPKEAVVISHILMLRTCMIKQVASGIYTYMPLALRSIRKIENIIREELDAVGCQELLMPTVQPSTLWEDSGRWQQYGRELLRFQDRKDNDFCLGPTHEEVVTDIARQEIRSYKDLPVNFYQIQTKFRDEIRPRFGLMRGREFIMKDAYSFDVDEEASSVSYQIMYEAYKRIFTRCGLGFRAVEADSGAIGGSYTHEFHVLASSGEDMILSCNNCEYAANAERCELQIPPTYQPEGDVPAPTKVSTPGAKTIEQLTGFLSVSAESCIKTLLFKADDQLVGACIPGDRELNEIAIRNLTGCIELEPASEADFARIGLTPGYLGPIDWPKDLLLYVDDAVMGIQGAVVGANEKDAHFTGVVPVLHIKPTKVVRLRAPRAGDTCVRCKEGVYETHRGIEVGQVFKLGTKYSVSMNANYLDTEGKEHPLVMGCYGIGVGRTMAAALEQNNDKNGIIWPPQIAPFHVMLLNLDIKNDTVTQTVDSLAASMRSKGVEVLIDDTPNRPGPKFIDADLIGLPVQVTVGARSLEKGQVELKNRRSGEKTTVALGESVDAVLGILNELGWRNGE